MATDHPPLPDRVRAILAAEPSVREVRMFGGLSFMVNDKILVAARSGGELLVRIPPERNPELVALPGATAAQMGAGRTMGPGWLSVAENALTSDEQLSFWIDVALEYNDRAGSNSRSR